MDRVVGLNLYAADVEEVTKKISALDKLYGKSVFITGGTGMICSAVVWILAYLNKVRRANIKIYLAGRNEEKMRKVFEGLEPGCDYFYVGFDAVVSADLPVVCDYYIYGASPADPASLSSQPVETILSNIVGLNTVLQSAAHGRESKVLYVSSSEVYGTKQSSEPYGESSYGFVDILNPRACYPCSKRVAETLCVSYAKEYGVNATIVRPGHIYGPTITPTDSRASAQFTRNAVHGENIVLKSAGLQLRSYCYVFDCASAMLAVLLNGENGEAYNISNSHSIVTIRQIAQSFADHAGTKLIVADSTAEEKKGYNLMDNSSLRSDKIERLGWSACFDLDRGVERTIKAIKAKGGC